MRQESLELLLARLYSDEAVLREFIGNPVGVARRFGVDDDVALEIDRDDLQLAAAMLARKRNSR